MSDLLKLVRLKSLEEIVQSLRDLIARHRRRFLKRCLPCPYNCKAADMVGRKVVGCSNCGSHDPDQCIQPSSFVPMFTKEELSEQFKAEIRDAQVLLRDYRDLFVFFWLFGAFDKKPQQVNEEIVSKAEKKHEIIPDPTGGAGTDHDVRVVRTGGDREPEQDDPKSEGADQAPATGQRCAGKMSTGASPPTCQKVNGTTSIMADVRGKQVLRVVRRSTRGFGKFEDDRQENLTRRGAAAPPLTSLQTT